MISKTLGRGLDSLISRTTGDAEPPSQVMTIPLSAIRPNPDQPRREFDEAALDTLARSIRTHGLLQPIVVQRGQDGFQLIAGERRVRASRSAGLESVPAMVIQADSARSLEMALVENIQRVDLGPLEEASAYEALLERGGLTHQELADRVGRSRATISNALRLLGLPDRVKGLLRSGDLTVGQARPLLGTASPAEAERLAILASRLQWTAREVERRVGQLKQRPPRQSPGPRPTRAEVPQYGDELRNLYGTKVSVQDDGGRGEVRFEFYSKADRDRLLHLLITGGRAVSERAV